jgi:small-conductance mechanosensitive channel
MAIALAPVMVSAQAPDVKVDFAAVLDRARTQMDKVLKKLDKPSAQPLEDAELVELRSIALEVKTQMESAVVALEPQLAGVKARLAELGEPPPNTPEAPDVAEQRKQLSKNSGNLEGQVKLARLITVEAGQAAEQLLKLRRAQFQAQLGRRTASILSDSFWIELRNEWPQDARRLAPLYNELLTTIAAISSGVWLGLLLAIAAVLGLWVLAGRALMRLSTTRVAPGRLRRSLYAAALVVLATTLPAAIAQLMYMALRWNSPLSEGMELMLGWLVGIVCFGGYVAGLGRALLAPERPSWRLPPMLDSVASGLRWFPVILAILIGGGWAAARLASLVNASLASTVALDYITSLTLGVTMGLAMSRAHRLRRQVALDPDKPAPAAYPFWVMMLVIATWLALGFSVFCLLVGYVALGSFIVKQVVWVALVLGSAYLLAVLIEDGANAVLAVIKRHAQDHEGSYSWTGARSQAVVLLSGLVRLLVVLIAFMLLLAPFGESPGEWLRRVEQLYAGIPIGEVQIRPTAVFLALLVLFVGLGGVRLLKHWLAEQYLPTTSLDPGMRLSAATLFGYAGYVLAVALALSAVGIGLERVAWIASALSGGIGFGLQAVVQNFVSGLILLAERPVKVGDWVSLSGVEGDIRRINVRATEIQMGDRSTVIVPNSEFITKIVRNVTHANPLGRVQIKFSMPVSTDAQQARELVLAAFKGNSDVREDPAPEVQLEGIDAAGLLFNATGYVSSPRMASAVRSALLFEMLKCLREAGMPLSTPTTLLLSDAGRLALPATSAVAGPAADQKS